MRKEKRKGDAKLIRVYPIKQVSEKAKHKNHTSVARQNSGHRLSPHRPLQGIYPAQHTYLRKTETR